MNYIGLLLRPFRRSTGTTTTSSSTHRQAREEARQARLWARAQDRIFWGQFRTWSGQEKSKKEMRKYRSQCKKNGAGDFSWMRRKP